MAESVAMTLKGQAAELAAVWKELQRMRDQLDLLYTELGMQQVEE